MTSLTIQLRQLDKSECESCVFSRSPVLIGRSEINDLCLADSHAGRRHAVIHFDASSITYLDLDPSQPSIVDGRALTPFSGVSIGPDAEVHIGQIALQLRCDIGKHDGSAGPSMRSHFPQRSDSTHASQFAETLYLSDADPAASLPDLDAALGALRGAAKVRDGLADRYHAYRDAAHLFVDAIRSELRLRTQDERESCLLNYQRRFPELTHDPAYRSLTVELGVDGTLLGHVDVEGWFKRLTQNTLSVGAPINWALALDRIAQVLELFAAEFIDRCIASRVLKRSAGVQHGHSSLLERINDPAGLFAYVLHPSRDARDRTAELARALGQLGLHDTALAAACSAQRQQHRDRWRRMFVRAKPANSPLPLSAKFVQRYRRITGSTRAHEH